MIRYCIAACLLAACAQGPAGFDRGAMLEHLGRQVIWPLHRDFADRSAALAQAAGAFAADPQTATLAAVQDGWKATAAAWKACELFEFGPAADDFIHYRIYKRPVRQRKIERYIAGSEPLDADFVAGVGAPAKGLAAIEYLIFRLDGDADRTLAAFSGAAGQRRRQYLEALCQDLRRTVDRLERTWSPDDDDYLAAFVAADSTGNDLQGSISLLVNQMVVLNEGIVRFRLPVPLGTEVGGVPQPSQTEARLSGASLELLRQNLEAYARVFTGDDGPGLDDYLNFLGTPAGEKPLAERVNGQIAAIRRTMDEIAPPLHKAVVEQNEAVHRLYGQFRELLVLTKVDLVQRLGVTLTFNKYDGD